MTGYEYKVVPAPTRGLKAKGVKGTPARFANALETVMNDLGAEGWEYQRTDTLPVEERQGLTGRTSTFQNMLVFRRTLPATEADPVEVAALIEDQTAVAGAEAETTADEPTDQSSETGLSDEAQARVQDTLEADGLTYVRPNASANKADSPEQQTAAD